MRGDNMSEMVTRLAVGPYNLPVYPTRRGPTLGIEDRHVEPLAMLLNVAASGDGPLAEAIEQRCAGSTQLLWVEPAPGASSDAVVREVGVEGANVVSWSELQRAVSELRERRATWTAPPGPWLFTSHPASPVTTLDEDDALRDLEAEARAVDKLDADAPISAEPVALIQRRRRLLASADALSLFDRHSFVGESGDARDNALLAVQATTLLGLRRAGLNLRELEVVGDDTSVLEGPVCIDFLRLRLWPQGDAAAPWMASGTSLLDPQSSGDQGVVLERVGASTVQAFWRRDGRRPCLLAVTSDR